MRILLATFYVAAMGAILLAVGLAVEWLICRLDRNKLQPLADAPIMGFAAIVVIGQGLAYYGVPLRMQAVPFAVLAVAGAVLALPGVLRAHDRRVVLVALAGAGAVYILHGWGIWASGIDAYLARAWGDQGNYVAIAAYLTDYPFGVDPPTTDPAAVIGRMYYLSRHGQSVLLGLLGLWLHVNPKILFEPVVILSAAFVFLGLFDLSRQNGFSPRASAVSAFFGASIPGLATIHLEGFMSQALGTAVLLVLPGELRRAQSGGLLGGYVRIGLLLAAGLAVYREYAVLYVAVIATQTAWGLWQATRRLPIVVGILIVTAIPVVLRSGNNMLGIYNEIGTDVLNGLYPWALEPGGVARLWFGDFSNRLHIGFALGMAAVIAGAAGLVWNLARCQDKGQAAALLLIVAFPLAVLIARPTAHYQFYKLLMSASPILAWGAAYLYLILPRLYPIKQVVAAGYLVLCTIGTFDMVKASTNPDLLPDKLETRRQHTDVTLAPGFLAAEAALDSVAGKDIVMCIHDASPNGSYTNLWLAIAGRNNRIWPLNPQLNEQRITTALGEGYIAAMPVPSAPFLVTTRNSGALWPVSGPVPRIGSSHEVLAGSGDAVLLCAPDMRVRDHRTGEIIVYETSRATFYSGADRSGILRFRSNMPVTLAIGASTGQFQAGAGSLPFCLSPGFSTLRIDPDPRGVGISDIQIELDPPDREGR